MPDCWMFPPSPPCYVLGGRFGDIIQMLPCFAEIRKRTGTRPVVISSKIYSNVYEGVTYVDYHSVNEGWWEMVPKAKALAEETYGHAHVVQFWTMPPAHDDAIGFRGKGWTVLQCHGHAHGVNMALDPDYGTSMARRCGFTRAEWVKLPLVFDRRNQVREKELVQSFIPNEQRPVVLYNFNGISSPFPFAPEVLNMLLPRFGRQFRMLDLGKVNAHRIYDLLGLYDRAVGLVTSDTATAHLAAGSKIPTIWFCVDGWTGSVPRGNVAFSCRYNAVRASLPKVAEVIGSWR